MLCEFSVLEWREFRQSEASTGRSSTARCHACAWRAVFTVKGMNSGKGIDPCPRSPPWAADPELRVWVSARERRPARPSSAGFVWHTECSRRRPRMSLAPWAPTAVWPMAAVVQGGLTGPAAGPQHLRDRTETRGRAWWLPQEQGPSTQFFHLIDFCCYCCFLHHSHLYVSFATIFLVLRWKVSHFTWVSFLS